MFGWEIHRHSAIRVTVTSPRKNFQNQFAWPNCMEPMSKVILPVGAVNKNVKSGFFWPLLSAHSKSISIGSMHLVCIRTEKIGIPFSIFHFKFIIVNIETIEFRCNYCCCFTSLTLAGEVFSIYYPTKKKHFAQTILVNSPNWNGNWTRLAGFTARLGWCLAFALLFQELVVVSK